MFYGCTLYMTILGLNIAVYFEYFIPHLLFSPECKTQKCRHHLRVTSRHVTEAGTLSLAHGARPQLRMRGAVLGCAPRLVPRSAQLRSFCHPKPGSVTQKPETTICVSTCNFNQISQAVIIDTLAPCIFFPTRFVTSIRDSLHIKCPAVRIQ